MRKSGYAQLVPSMGISYIAVVLLRFTQKRCLGGIRKVTPKVALEDLLRALVGKKGCEGETKTGDMSKKKNILAQGEGRFKRTDQCQVPLDTNVLTGRIKNSNACVDW